VKGQIGADRDAAKVDDRRRLSQGSNPPPHLAALSSSGDELAPSQDKKVPPSQSQPPAIGLGTSDDAKPRLRPERDGSQADSASKQRQLGRSSDSKPAKEVLPSQSAKPPSQPVRLFSSNDGPAPSQKIGPRTPAIKLSSSDDDSVKPKPSGKQPPLQDEVLPGDSAAKRKRAVGSSAILSDPEDEPVTLADPSLLFISSGSSAHTPKPAESRNQPGVAPPRRSVVDASDDDPAPRVGKESDEPDSPSPRHQAPGLPSSDDGGSSPKTSNNKLFDSDFDDQGGLRRPPSLVISSDKETTTGSKKVELSAGSGANNQASSDEEPVIRPARVTKEPAGKGRALLSSSDDAQDGA
jgi:hypothetical protein